MIELLYKLKVTCDICKRTDIIQRSTQYSIPSLPEEHDLPPNWIRIRWKLYEGYGANTRTIAVCPHCDVQEARKIMNMPKDVIVRKF